jgi:ABC-type transporter Mla MlaB component
VASLDLVWKDDLNLTNCVRALEAFKPLVSEALRGSNHLQCRLVGWGRVDTSALTVLLALRRLAAKAHAQIEFLDSSETLKALARMSQVEGLLSLQ